MSDTISRKIYVRPDNTAVITCPHCNRQKTVPVGSYMGSKSRVKIKCGCKNVFTVNLEFRKKNRKETNLRGKFTNHSKKDFRGDIVVKNLSLGGLEFVSMDVDKFEIDDEITVSFKLDNEERTTIKKEVIVKDLRDNTVGCEFQKSSEFAPDKELGFYIMS